MPHFSKDAELDKLEEALNTLSVWVHNAHQQGSSPDTVVRAWATMEGNEDVVKALKLDGVDEMRSTCTTRT